MMVDIRFFDRFKHTELIEKANREFIDKYNFRTILVGQNEPIDFTTILKNS
jgi:hypothetical protein